jgi:hypothetical protein
MLGGAVLLSTFIGHATIGRAALDERSAHRRELHLTIHNTHQEQTSMHPEGFESTIPANKRLHAQALELAATGIGAISVSRTACFTLSFSPERFNYSTSILLTPQTFLEYKLVRSWIWTALLLPSYTSAPHTSCDLFNFAFEGKWYKVDQNCLTGLNAGVNFWQESS